MTDAVKKANLSGCLAIAIWSTSALLVSYSGGVPPLLSASLNLLVAFLVTACVWGLTRQNIARIFKQKPACYLVGVGGITAYWGAYCTALKIAPIVESNLINYLWPLFIVIFSPFILKTKLTALQLAGVTIGFAGAALIILSKDGSGFDASNLALYLPALLAAVVWGLYSNLTRLVAFDHHFMGVIYLCSGLILLALHFIFETAGTLTLSSLAALAVLGVTTISYSFWDFAMKKGDVVMIASLSYLIPLFSTLLLIMFSRGAWSLATLAAGGLIIAGSVTANFVKIRDYLARFSR